MPVLDPIAHRDYQRRWRESNPAKNRATYRRGNLKRHYGITPHEWDKMYEDQQGRCAICGTDSCVTGRRLSVDHDHATGRVRGLLCYRCNTFIGWAETTDLPMEEVVARLTRYLGRGA